MAAIVWTKPTGATHSATTTCGTADTFNSGASDGADLSGVDSIAVDVTAAASQTITAAGTLKAYLLNPYTGLWNRCPGLDLNGTLTGVRGESFAGFQVYPGVGARIGYEPSGFTVSSGNLTISITCGAKLPNGQVARL